RPVPVPLWPSADEGPGSEAPGEPEPAQYFVVPARARATPRTYGVPTTADARSVPSPPMVPPAQPPVPDPQRPAPRSSGLYGSGPQGFSPQISSPPVPGPAISGPPVPGPAISGPPLISGAPVGRYEEWTRTQRPHGTLYGSGASNASRPTVPPMEHSGSLTGHLLRQGADLPSAEPGNTRVVVIMTVVLAVLVIAGLVVAVFARNALINVLTGG
ncbi:MAG: hypothetical protein QOE03_156, partial [Micromonosporaceae bacterium]|nr:hypothetical protein [Micromonosporaceae bacterium]